MTAQAGAALDVAERVLSNVREQAGGEAAEAEVTVQRGSRALTRFATSFIHQNVAEDVSHVVLRVALDGRTASSSLDGPTDEATLGRLVDNVLAAARVAPPDAGWPGLTQPTPGAGNRPLGRGNGEVRSRRPSLAGRSVRRRGRGPRDGRGVLDDGDRSRVREQRRAHGDGSHDRGHDRRDRPDADGRRLRAPNVGPRPRHRRPRCRLLAGARARAASDPIDIEPGRYEVILAQGAVSNLLSSSSSTASTPRPSRKAARSSASGSSSSIRPCRSATTSPTRR